MKISDELREWADVHCDEECEEYLGLLADRMDCRRVRWRANYRFDVRVL